MHQRIICCWSLGISMQESMQTTTWWMDLLDLIQWLKLTKAENFLSTCVWYMILSRPIDFTNIKPYTNVHECIHDVRVHRYAAGAIVTDHHLLCAKIKLYLKSRKQHQRPKPLMYGSKKFQHQSFVENFQQFMSAVQWKVHVRSDIKTSRS